MLLRDALPRRPPTALETGLEELNRETREAEAKRALREALADWDRRRTCAPRPARHYGPYWQGLPTAAHVVFARLLRDLGDDEIRIDLHARRRTATRPAPASPWPTTRASSRRLAGALALVGANVVDARTYTSKDGYATAVFWVQDADGHPYEAARLPRLRADDRQDAEGRGRRPRGAAGPRQDQEARARASACPTSITFDNEGSDIYTIIEVDTRDRPGLLYDLTRTLAAPTSTSPAR